MGPLGYVLAHVFAAFHRHKSAASNPGRVRTSRAKLKSLAPHFFASPARPRSWISWLFGLMLTRRAALKMHLRYGDSRAAVVVSAKPLVIAAYSDDFDGVLLLQFPQPLVDEM